MTTDSGWALQAGLYAHLTATSVLTSQLADGANSILDHVPGGTPFPYIVLGEMTSKPSDTHTFSGNDAVVTLHVFSRVKGLQETKNILSAIHDAVHNADIPVEDHTLVLCQHQQTDVFLESDGLTRHGVIRFRMITEPTA